MGAYLGLRALKWVLYLGLLVFPALKLRLQLSYLGLVQSQLLSTISLAVLYLALVLSFLILELLQVLSVLDSRLFKLSFLFLDN